MGSLLPSEWQALARGEAPVFCSLASAFEALCLPWRLMEKGMRNQGAPGKEQGS